MKGLLVVLEGIDGTGKTTLAAGLEAALSERGRRVVRTREPTDGPFGRRIRALAAGGRDGITAEEELALFHADRREHVATVVRPALASGAVVVQDRSYFSTIAYQGERGLDRARILEDSERIAPRPDVLLILDLPVDEALRRISTQRPDGADDFEKAEALARIRQIFLTFEAAEVLDARDAPETLLARALAIIDRHASISATVEE